MQGTPFRQDELRRVLAGLDGDFVLLETSKMLAGNSKSLLFSKPLERLRCTLANVDSFLARCEDVLARGHYLAGWFSYEYGYFLEPVLRPLADSLPGETVLADLGVFAPPNVFDHLAGKWAQEPHLAGGISESPFMVENISLSQTEEEYLHHLGRIKEYIRAGDTYQVNYTLKLLFAFVGRAVDLYLHLRANQGVGYGAFIRTDDSEILSFSPELFFAKEGNGCTVRPMKGTCARGRTPAEDEEMRRFLATDPKNKSENVMIVDLLRNDLGRLARPDTVHVTSLFDVETYESLHQMTSTIQAKLPDEVDLHHLFRALFPCGSVTGAPKIRTMEIIKEMETGPRGVYCGAIGYLTPKGDGCFNVPIRTVVLDQQGRGEMGIGSGIVADSSPEGEWQECGLKAHFLTHSHSFELIETLLWQPGDGYWLLDGHLSRLAASARHFNFQLDIGAVTAELASLAASFPRKPQRVRLLLNRDGDLSLVATPCPAPAFTSLTGAAKAPPLELCALAAERVESSDTFLYHKTSRRALFNLAFQQAQERGLADLLFVNGAGQLTEGAISSIFIKKDGQFFTPPLTCGLLAGVLRAHLLARHKGLIREEVLTVADLEQADAIFLVNSVRGVRPVRLRQRG